MADPLEALRLVVGAVFVLVVPGLAWTFLFFPQTRPIDAPRERDGIDWLERVALAFGLSIALVPITVFLLNYFLKVPLNVATAMLIVLALTAAPVPWILKRNPRLLRGRGPREPPHATEQSQARSGKGAGDAGGQN
jgi:uncharacterized membrane protein